MNERGTTVAQRRTSRGVRGLKSCFMQALLACLLSHLSRGAWIEIKEDVENAIKIMVAPLAGCVD